MTGEVASVWNGGPSVSPAPSPSPSPSPPSSISAADVGYLGNGATAILYNVQDRLRTEYWLQDYYDPLDGDDWAIAMGRALTAAQAVDAGAVINIPAGTFKFFSQIDITWPNTVRATIEGAGMGLTFIEDWRAAPSATEGLFAFDFSADLNSRYFQCEFGKMTITKMVDATTFTAPNTYVIGTGIGISINQMAMPGKFYDLQIYGYKTAILGTDTLEATFDHIHIQYAEIGIKLLKGTFSQPNITSISRCLIAACKLWGIQVFGGSPINLHGCDFSFCGDIALTAGALYYDYDTLSPTGINVNGCYFEGNRGIADIAMNNSTGVIPNIANNINGCMFARTDGTYFTTNNIVSSYSGTAGGKVKTSVRGCGFQGFNSYVPDAGRIYVVSGGTNSGLVSLNIDSGNLFGAVVETPASGGGGGTTLDDVLTAGNASAQTAQVGALQLGGAGASMTNSGSNITMNGVIGIAQGPTGGVAPLADGTQFLGGNALRFSGAYVNTITIGTGTGAITGSGNNVVLNNVVSAIPGIGIAPNIDNTYVSGSPSFRWQSGYFGTLNISTNLVWGATTIASPPGGTTNFLRADGTWAAPAGGGGGSTLNAVLTAGNTSALGMTVGSVTLTGGGVVSPSGSNVVLNGTVFFTTTTGQAPVTDATYQSGSPSFRWSNVYTVNASVASTITWAGISMATPTGSSSQFLAGDGVWRTPSGTGGTVTSVTAGASLTGGTITTTGTIALDSTVGVVVGTGFAPGVDNAYVLGGSAKRWTTVFATTGTINTSDERDKTEVTPSDLGLDFINSLIPVSYKWKEGSTLVSIDTNTDEKTVTGVRPGKRTFYGLLAQDVKKVLGNKDFAGWTLDDPADPESKQGLRYTEFIAPLITAIQELTARVKQLESAK
jgi:hypothetical protein